MEKMIAFAHLMPTVDPWGQEITETLDVAIPYPVKYTSPSKETFEHAKVNLTNFFKNSSTMSSLISLRSLPGFRPHNSWRQRIRNSLQAFKVQSVEPDALIAPFRKLALKSYEDLNMAIANQADKDVKKFTTFTYQDRALELAKSFRKKNPNGRNIWQLHRTLTPTQVLSMRAMEGYLADAEPRYGNRLLVHALVKFDTEQSLEMYDARGNPLHTPAELPYMVDSDKPLESWRVPAGRKRVTEYLILEKRMWIPGNWQFREQLWPAAKP
ncbi:hypothetical protein M413DRAFT_267576 [Hebeloma cylindrosporum]|uniref:Uncharacterized protein n=1 Tax=Hebeloma cylindrosporum TaxID=76867 RepID=A0A0C3CDY9_HEBCY|nr:hypothetical protein M413DRAFT_267576 [Hebeloma cylindrosporum h7]